jgi:predicted phage tail protein
VVLNITSGDTSEATVNVPMLTFTAANWNVAQTVTVSGVFDNILDGTQTPVITIAVDDALSDDAFDPLADQTVSATVLDVANRPVVTAPTGANNPALPTFTWDDVAGETSYALWLINKATGTLVFSRDDIAADAISYALTETDVPGGLAPGDYRFWINTISANGYSQSGAPTDFSVGAAAVVPAAPSITGTSGLANQPTINWSAVSGAVTYSVYLINLDTSAVINSQTGIATTSSTPGAALADGRYRIWVSATNAAGSSPWSTPFDFSIGTAPTTPPATPTGFSAGNTNTTTPTVTWTADAAGTKYAIWFINLDTNTLISGETNLTTAAFTPASPLVNGHYRIWVRAYNSVGSSGWSTPFDFEVVA